MAILQGDIKLLKSEVMNDEDEGGGGAIGAEVVDGLSNNLFDDISDLDRVYGNLSLRKVHVGVRVANTDGYYGVHAIVSRPPEDSRVSAVLFATGDAYDRRVEAASRIQAYLAAGPSYAGLLYGDHLAGQMTVTLIQREAVDLPPVGETLVLRKLAGTAGEFEQYVRITGVESTLQDFEDAVQPTAFTRRVVTLQISDQLREDFPGFDALRLDASINYTGKTRLYTTIVADAARYYGIVPLAQAASMGDFVARAGGIFASLVPSAQIETPIADARLNQQLSPLLVSGEAVSYVVNAQFHAAQGLYIGGSVLPGSVTLTVGGTTLADKGGALVNLTTADKVGTIDYANGIAALSSSVFGTGSVAITIAYKPALQPTIVTEAAAFDISEATQRLTYVLTLTPAPARASLQVSYRAQSRWYVLTEDGSGALRGGDSAVGVGTLNFTTGTVSLTLGALPDVDSKVILQWATSSSAPALGDSPAQAGRLTDRFFWWITIDEPIDPGTLVVTWNDGAARTVTDDDGALTGYGVGEVQYAQGAILLAPTTLPPVGTELHVVLQKTNLITTTLTDFGDGGAVWTFSLGGACKPGTFEGAIAASTPVREFPGKDRTRQRVVHVFDDGAGNLTVPNITGYLTIGTINYSTGACTINKTTGGFNDAQRAWSASAPIALGGSAADPKYVRQIADEIRVLTLTVLDGPAGSLALPSWGWWSASFAEALRARFGRTSGAAYSADITPDELLARGYHSEFRLGGVLHRSLMRGGERLIERDPSPTTGVGTEVGTANWLGPAGFGNGARVETVYDYDSGSLTLTDWPSGISPVIADGAGLVPGPVSGADTTCVVDAAIFRTAVAPVRSASLNLVGEWADDGATFSVTGDGDGRFATGGAPVSDTIAGTRGVFGTVDYESGVVEVRFASRVNDTPTNRAKPGAADLSYLGIPGLAWALLEGVRSDSLRYNASAYTYLPLDAEILGIDPVRLPSDGRVPIFRSGSVAVVHHTTKTAAAAAVNGGTVNCGRQRLASVRVLGFDGATIDDGYTVDLDDGIVTWTDVAGYSQPVRVEHRIQDACLVADAQISGQLRFTRALTHDYPLGSYVSSALLIGDMGARVSLMFDQVTWTSVWSDDRIGSDATATYDAINNPPEVDNLGTVTERWALIFTGATAFNIVGEHRGVVATGSTTTGAEPLNPVTMTPYFSLAAAGFGSGWAIGNVLRLNTVGALAPMWAARVVQQGPATVDDDAFELLVLGDIDTP